MVSINHTRICHRLGKILKVCIKRTPYALCGTRGSYKFKYLNIRLRYVCCIDPFTVTPNLVVRLDKLGEVIHHLIDRRQFIVAQTVLAVCNNLKHCGNLITVLMRRAVLRIGINEHRIFFVIPFKYGLEYVSYRVGLAYIAPKFERRELFDAILERICLILCSVEESAFFKLLKLTRLIYNKILKARSSLEIIVLGFPKQSTLLERADFSRYEFTKLGLFALGFIRLKYGLLDLHLKRFKIGITRLKVSRYPLICGGLFERIVVLYNLKERIDVIHIGKMLHTRYLACHIGYKHIHRVRIYFIVCA